MTNNQPFSFPNILVISAKFLDWCATRNQRPFLTIAKQQQLASL
jgi:hypothetical protein